MSRRILPLPHVGSRWYSLTLLAATVLMVLAVLAGAAGTADAGSPSEQRKFKTQFQGKFDTPALATGVPVPAGSGFGETFLVAHKCDFSFFTVGNSASAGVQALAEGGSISDFQAEVTAAVAAGNAQASWTIGAPNSPTGNKNGPSSVPVEDEFSCLTVLVKINPTSDWFAGVSAHDLRAGGTWPTPGNNNSIFVDLFPFDAGTLDGTEFATSTTATSPQGTIASLRNTGKFSDNRIARLKLQLKNPALTRDVVAEAGIESITVTWGEVAAAGGYHVMWKSGAEAYDTDGSFGRRHDVVDGKTRTHTITGLTGGVVYDVQVIAYNEAGQSTQEPTSVSRDRATPISAATADNTVLVGNATQRYPSTEQLGMGSQFKARAQAFTTGSESALLGSVTLPEFRKRSNNALIDVHIYSASGIDPAAKLHTLTRPDFSSLGNGVGSELTFNAAAGAPITLAANTTYFAYAELIQGEVSLLHTKDDDEDPDSDEGWSMADRCRAVYSNTLSTTPCASAPGGFTAALVMVLNSPLAAGTPTLSIEGSEAVEGTGVQFTVSLSSALAEEVTVEYGTADDSATTADSDYTAVSNATLTFAASETEKTVTIDTTADSTDEDDESFTVVAQQPVRERATGVRRFRFGSDHQQRPDHPDRWHADFDHADRFRRRHHRADAGIQSVQVPLHGNREPRTRLAHRSRRTEHLGNREHHVCRRHRGHEHDGLRRRLAARPGRQSGQIHGHLARRVANQVLQNSRQQGRRHRRDAGIPEPRRQHHEHPGCAHAVARLQPSHDYIHRLGGRRRDQRHADRNPEPRRRNHIERRWSGSDVGCGNRGTVGRRIRDQFRSDGRGRRHYEALHGHRRTHPDRQFDAAAYSVDEGESVQVSVSLDGVPGNEVRANLSTTLQGATTPDFEACRNTSRWRVPMRSRPSISLRGPTSPVTLVRA